MAVIAQMVNSIATSRATILPGGTLALFVDVLPGQIWTQIKNVGNTGGLEIIQCSTGSSLVGGGSQLFFTPNFLVGSTQTPAMLAALSGTGYLMGTNEVLSIDGPVRFYISAPSATCVVTLIKGLDAGV